MDRIDFWDLDYTLYTKKPILPILHTRLAKVAGCSINVVNAQAAALPGAAFTLEKLFTNVQLPPELWEQETAQWFDTMQQRAERCIFPNILAVLAERATVARQVLVTKANPHWQIKKFSALTPLHPFFAKVDRHFVGPEESKGRIIASYTGSKMFIDDSPSQLRDAREHSPETKRIRMMWPSEQPAADPDDGTLWKVATNADELRTAFADCQ